MSETIKDPKFELRKGEKNGKKWQGIGFTCEYEGAVYKGIAFPPRDTFGSGEELKVQQ